MASKDSFCGHCGEAASDRCKCCANMTYCSVECQQADWQYHKHLCKQWADFKEKPAPDMRRAILLPEHGSKPTFKWLKVPEGSDAHAAEQMRRTEADEEGDEDEGDEVDISGRSDVSRGFPDTEQTFGPGAAARNYIKLVCGKQGSGELLDHSIHLWTSGLEGGLGPNECLAKLAGRKIAHRYRGELVFVAMPKYKSTGTLDFDTRDLTLALDGLVEYFKAGQLNYLFLPKQPKKLKGLKVNVTEPFILEGIKIPIRHPIFSSKNDNLPLMANIQIPTCMYNYRTPSAVSATATNTLESYLELNLLRTNIDLESSQFGTAPAKFHDEDGSSMLLAQKDVDFMVLDLVRLIAFLKKRVEPQLSLMRAMNEDDRRTAWEEFKMRYKCFEGMAQAGLLL